jgi:hypothetical protein
MLYAVFRFRRAFAKCSAMKVRFLAALFFVGLCLAVSLVGSLVSSCSYQRAEVAADAKSKMIGMSREQVLACMGAPSQHAIVGETEVWSYPSGGDTHTFSTASGSVDAAGNANAFGSSYSQHRYCVVNVVMTGDRVSAVNYTGRTGGWATHGEQCAFAVQNCIE